MQHMNADGFGDLNVNGNMQGPALKQTDFRMLNSPFLNPTLDSTLSTIFSISSFPSLTMDSASKTLALMPADSAETSVETKKRRRDGYIDSQDNTCSKRIHHQQYEILQTNQNQTQNQQIPAQNSSALMLTPPLSNNLESILSLNNNACYISPVLLPDTSTAFTLDDMSAGPMMPMMSFDGLSNNEIGNCMLDHSMLGLEPITPKQLMNMGSASSMAIDSSVSSASSTGSASVPPSPTGGPSPTTGTTAIAHSTSTSTSTSTSHTNSHTNSTQGKTSHAVAEQRRRDSFKQLLDTVREILPDEYLKVTDRVSKIGVLERVIEYVKDTQEREKAYQTREKEMSELVRKLRMENAELRSQWMSMNQL